MWSRQQSGAKASSPGAQVPRKGWGHLLRDPSECCLRLPPPSPPCEQAGPEPLYRRETEAWASGHLLRPRNWATAALGLLQDCASDTRL